MEDAMNRLLAGSLLASAVALAVAACGDDSGANVYPWAGGACGAYTTCATCTPVEGCGWCFNAHGGVCTSDPDQCASASEFTWTWDPTGCPDVDASVNPADGAARGGADAAGDAAPAAADAGGDGNGPATHPGGGGDAGGATDAAGGAD
jgi:hypothetical protein